MGELIRIEKIPHFDKLEDDDRLYYHYCSMTSFMSIVKSGVIWLNDIRKMNDPTENYIAGVSLLQEVNKKSIAELIEKLKSGELETTRERLDWITEMWQINDKQHVSNIPYIFSMTKVCDDLNQWRLYGDNCLGVCFGFDKNIIENISNIYCDVHFNEIEYKPLSTYLDDIVSDIFAIKTIENINAFNKLHSALIRAKEEQAKSATIKDVAYIKEEEVRIIRYRKDTSIDNDIEFTLSGNDMVGHLALKLEKLGLKKIILGPLNSNSADNIRTFLSYNGLNANSVKICKSDLPYRITK